MNRDNFKYQSIQDLIESDLYFNKQNESQNELAMFQYLEYQNQKEE